MREPASQRPFIAAVMLYFVPSMYLSFFLNFSATAALILDILNRTAHPLPPWNVTNGPVPALDTLLVWIHSWFGVTDYFYVSNTHGWVNLHLLFPTRLQMQMLQSHLQLVRFVSMVAFWGTVQHLAWIHRLGSNSNALAAQPSLDCCSSDPLDAGKNIETQRKPIGAIDKSEMPVWFDFGGFECWMAVLPFWMWSFELVLYKKSLGRVYYDPCPDATLITGSDQTTRRWRSLPVMAFPSTDLSCFAHTAEPEPLTVYFNTRVIRPYPVVASNQVFYFDGRLNVAPRSLACLRSSDGVTVEIVSWHDRRLAAQPDRWRERM